MTLVLSPLRRHAVLRLPAVELQLCWCSGRTSAVWVASETGVVVAAVRVGVA